jgi:hypothetical protein
MASQTRVNPVAGAGSGYDHGVHYSTSQITAIEIDCGVNISAKDGIGGCIEAVVREFSPLMYVSTGTAGKIFAIIDGHHSDAASLTRRHQALGTVDGVDLSAQVVLIRDLDALSAA